MARRGEWTPAGGGQIYGRGPSNPAPVQNNAVGSSPAAVAAMIQNTAPPPPPPPPPSTQQIQPAVEYIPQSSGPAPSYSVPPPPPPKPMYVWNAIPTYVQPVKQADPDIIVTDEEPISPELLLELGYEEISGIELINISRSDLINGQNVIYSPIKNLSSIRRKYNPNNVIAMPAVSSSIFSKYAIDLILRIGENPETGEPYEPYFNENGDLVIEIEDVREDELVEVEIDSNGTINLVDFI